MGFEAIIRLVFSCADPAGVAARHACCTLWAKSSRRGRDGTRSEGVQERAQVPLLVFRQTGLQHDIEELDRVVDGE